MPVSFSEFSEALLLERKFDQEMGQAAEKSYTIFSEILIDAIEKMGDHFIKILQKKDSGLSDDEMNLRNDIYIYAGRGYLIPHSRYTEDDWDDRLLGLNVKELMNDAMSKKLDDSIMVQQSKIIGVNRSIMVFKHNTDLIVLPKSITNKQLAKIFMPGSPPGIIMKLHSSMNTQTNSEKDSAIGLYYTPKTSYATSTSAEIHLSGFTCFDPEAVLPLVKYLVQNRDKPNLMRKAVKDWVAIANGNLRSAKSVYIHEYTHFLDDIRMAGVEPKNVIAGREAIWKQDKDYGTYFKSDIEWNAHFQEIAESARASMRDFMTCIPNNAVAFSALEDKMDEVGGKYIVKKPYQAAWNGLIADKIESIIFRLLDNVSAEKIKYYTDWTQSQHNFRKEDSQRVLNIFVRQGKTLIGRLFLYVFNLFLSNKGGFTDFMLKDEKFRKRFYTRIYSVAEDLKKIYDDGIAKVRAGKFPSKQAWNAAIKNYHSIPATDIKSLKSSKFWTNIKVPHPAHLELYSGSFMKSFLNVNGPFDPNKPLDKSLQAFTGL